MPPSTAGGTPATTTHAMNTTLARNIAAERHFNFSRRNFLRGLGACIALPAFESFRPLSLVAAPAAGKLAATTTGAPLRSAFLFFPNGAIPSAWWPKGDGNEFEFSSTLKPLETLRRHLQVLGGLDQKA